MSGKIDRKALMKAGMEKEAAAVEKRFAEPSKDRWAAAEEAMSTRPGGLAVAPPEEGAKPPEKAVRGQARPQAEEGGSMTVPLDKTHDNPWNARRIYEPEKVAALAASIEAKGQIYPAPAVPHPDLPGHWVLIDGHYRRRALEQIGKGVIAILPRPASPPREMFRLSFALNEERSAQTALDNAMAWDALLSEGVYVSAEELAGAVGLSPAKVAKVMALLKLPVPALEIMRENPSRFGPAVGYELYLCSARMQEGPFLELVRRVLAEDLSLRDVEAVRSSLEHPSQRRRKEVSRQYKIRAGEAQVGTIKEWDSGRVALDVRIEDPAVRADLVEELKRRFGIEGH